MKYKVTKMYKVKTILISITSLFAITYIGFCKPIISSPPPPPPILATLYSSLSVPNSPFSPMKLTEQGKLREEYKGLEFERSQLQKEFTQISFEITTSKQRIRTSSTAFGKWLARRDLQQQIETLNKTLYRFDQIDERQRQIRKIVRDVASEVPERTGYPMGNSLPIRNYPFPKVSGSNPSGRQSLSPLFPPPPSDKIPVLPPYPRLSKEQIQQKLEKVKQERNHLLQRTKQHNQEIQQLENQLKGMETTNTNVINKLTYKGIRW